MPSAKNFLTSAAAAALVLAAWAAPQTAAGDHPKPAAGEETAKAGETAKKKKRGGCAFRRAINGFSVIDDEHFVLEAGSRDFLVTLSPGCHTLNFEMAIAIKSTPSAGICVERGDRVILDNHFTCWIREIEAVEDKKEARKLVEERKKAKQEEKKDKSG